MKVVVVGGGAGGLWFAAQLKLVDPAHEVVVLEGNGPDDAYGFGVVFSEQTVDRLRDADAETYGALQAEAEKWREIEVRHGGRSVTTTGHSFWAITRRQLLRVLQRRAAGLGVELAFGRRVGGLEELPEADLVVAADGVNSVVRECLAEDFQPAWRSARSNYIWLGATHRFPTFSFIFEQSEAGPFGAHAYPIAPSLSTFVVDAETEALRRAGLDPTLSLPPGESDEETVRYLSELFATHLDGGELVGNNSKWLHFRELRCASWRSERCVLLGDAAHTAHPSVGSGTKLAMEDGVALARALSAEPDVARALENYERERRPGVERVQGAAEAGSRWWDCFGAAMSLPTDQFVLNYLTRTPRITRDELRTRDRALVRSVDRWWAESHQSVGPLPALATPCRLGDLRLDNRVGVVCPLPTRHADAAALDAAVETIAGAARWGAGLVVADLGDAGLEDVDLNAARAAAAAVEGAGAGTIALRVRSGDPAAFAVAAEARVRVLILAPPEPDAAELAAIAAAAEIAPFAVGVELRLTSADIENPGAALQRARLLGPGIDFLASSFTGCEDSEGRTAAHHLAGLLRIQAGLPLVLLGATAGDDEASTVVLSGRADLCCGGVRLGQREWGAPAFA